MSDAALKVDPDYYSNTRLLGNTLSGGVDGGGGGGGPSFGGGGADGSSVRGLPDLPDYLVRQHSLLGFYLSLNPGDEADAERHWGFPQPQRAAIAGVTVVVPLVLALFLDGSWLWKACVISVVTVGARLVVSFCLATFSEVEVTVQEHTLAVWPHFVLGTLAFTGLIWFVTAAASGTGWSTMWLCFTSLLFLACAEAALRGVMWHFRWWAPTARFAFLKPWGDSLAAGGAGGRAGLEGGGLGSGGYAPPRPSAAPPAVAPRTEYDSIGMGARGVVGVGGSAGIGGGSLGGVGGGRLDEDGGEGGCGHDGVQRRDINVGGRGADNGAAAPVVAPRDENTGLLEGMGDGSQDLEDIFKPES